METFEKLLAGLSRCGVDFILVGGLAVALCGYVRATLDVDILVQTSPDNLARLLACLEDFGEGSAQALRAEDFTLEEGCIRIIEDFPLDVFTIVSGKTFEDLQPYVAQHALDDTNLHYLNAEGLLLLKSSSLRPKDQQDVLALGEMLRRKKRG